MVRRREELSGRVDEKQVTAAAERRVVVEQLRNLLVTESQRHRKVPEPAFHHVFDCAVSRPDDRGQCARSHGFVREALATSPDRAVPVREQGAKGALTFPEVVEHRPYAVRRPRQAAGARGLGAKRLQGDEKRFSAVLPQLEQLGEALRARFGFDAHAPAGFRFEIGDQRGIGGRRQHRGHPNQQPDERQ